MKSRKMDPAGEKVLLVGMIDNTDFLARLSPIWENNLFSSAWTNLIAGWCMGHFREFGTAPVEAIEPIYLTWADKHQKEEETCTAIERFLTGLTINKTPRGITADYLLDLAGHCFNKHRLEIMLEEAQQSLEQNDPISAGKKVNEYTSLQLGFTNYSDVVSDILAIEAMFTSKQDPLITFTGEGLAPIGEFFGGALERDSFIAFMGPEKRGKTWILLDMAWRAMEQGRRVAFFEVGDMSHSQLLRRMMVRATGRPLKAGEVKIPMDIRLREGPSSEREEESPQRQNRRRGRRDAPVRQREENGESRRPALSTVDTFHKPYRKALSRERTYKVLDRLHETHGIDFLRLSCHPNSSISVLGIRAILKEWEQSGWIPDIVVIDYADILAPAFPKEQPIDQINTTWKLLRGMSQQLHCLVLTATQANASSYEAHTIDRTHFSGNKLKLAHVTGMVGLSATPGETASGILRMNWVVLREGDFKDNQFLHVAGCLAVGNPMMVSLF